MRSFEVEGYIGIHFLWHYLVQIHPIPKMHFPGAWDLCWKPSWSPRIFQKSSCSIGSKKNVLGHQMNSQTVIQMASLLMFERLFAKVRKTHALWCRGESTTVPRFVSVFVHSVEAEDSCANPWVAIQDGWDQRESTQAKCRQQPSRKDFWESNETSWEHQVYGTCPNRIFTWKVHEWHGQGREWLDSNATTHRAIRRATCQAEQWCIQAGFADCHENQSSSEKGKVLSWRSFLQDGHRSFAASL